MKPEHRARQRVCVVMPAYNEEARIGAVVEAAHRHVQCVIVIDDGSSDDTSGAAAAAGAEVLRHPVNRGKGVALNTGFQYVHDHGFEVVICMDSDGQHDPEELPKFIEAYVRTGIPVLIGNRMADIGGMPRVRRMTNRLMSWLLGRAMGLYVPDTQCGYRLYRADVIPFVSADSERFAAESEILLNIAARGIRIDSVRVSTIYGDEVSKIHPLPDTIRFIRMLRRFYRVRRCRRV